MSVKAARNAETMIREWKTIEFGKQSKSIFPSVRRGLAKDSRPEKDGGCVTEEDPARTRHVITTAESVRHNARAARKDKQRKAKQLQNGHDDERARKEQSCFTTDPIPPTRNCLLLDLGCNRKLKSSPYRFAPLSYCSRAFFFLFKKLSFVTNNKLAQLLNDRIFLRYFSTLWPCSRVKGASLSSSNELLTKWTQLFISTASYLMCDLANYYVNTVFLHARLNDEWWIKFLKINFNELLIMHFGLYTLTLSVFILSKVNQFQPFVYYKNWKFKKKRHGAFIFYINH